MDLAGIEPASENPSLKASPITAAPFTFPQGHGKPLPYPFGSFILRLPSQSFDGIASYDHDAGLPGA